MYRFREGLIVIAMLGGKRHAIVAALAEGNKFTAIHGVNGIPITNRQAGSTNAFRRLVAELPKGLQGIVREHKLREATIACNDPHAESTEFLLRVIEVPQEQIAGAKGTCMMTLDCVKKVGACTPETVVDPLKQLIAA